MSASLLAAIPGLDGDDSGRHQVGRSGRRECRVHDAAWPTTSRTIAVNRIKYTTQLLIAPRPEELF